MRGLLCRTTPSRVAWSALPSHAGLRFATPCRAKLAAPCQPCSTIRSARLTALRSTPTLGPPASLRCATEQRRPRPAQPNPTRLDPAMPAAPCQHCPAMHHCTRLRRTPPCQTTPRPDSASRAEPRRTAPRLTQHDRACSALPCQPCHTQPRHATICQCITMPPAPPCLTLPCQAPPPRRAEQCCHALPALPSQTLLQSAQRHAGQHRAMPAAPYYAAPSRVSPSHARPHTPLPAMPDHALPRSATIAKPFEQRQPCRPLRSALHVGPASLCQPNLPAAPAALSSTQPNYDVLRQL